MFASSAAAVYAAPVLFLGLHEGHYQSIRHTILEEGGTEEEADRIGSQLAPFGAGLELFSERLGGKLLAGRLPAFEKALGRAMDGISSAPLRFAARAGTGWAQEGVQEIAQGYVDEVVLDLGHALGMDVKDRQWLGEGGVFDGDFAANLDTFVQAGPLAVAGAAKGMAREARIRAFIEASDDTLLAIGIQPDAVDKIRKAKGPEEQEAAINRGFEHADPQSETARDASHRLKQHAEDVRIDADELKAEGVVPPVTRLRDGTWVARDQDTGEELVRTKDLSGASRLMESSRETVRPNARNRQVPCNGVLKFSPGTPPPESDSLLRARNAAGGITRCASGTHSPFSGAMTVMGIRARTMFPFSFM